MDDNGAVAEEGGRAGGGGGVEFKETESLRYVSGKPRRGFGRMEGELTWSGKAKK